MQLPTRWVETPAVRARFGARLDRLAGFLTQGDPLADAVVEALGPLPHAERTRLIDATLHGAPDATLPTELVRLRDATHVPPVWLDEDRIARGGEVFMRAGLLGGIVLALRSIVFGYLAPAGNKPLVFSGRLERDVPRRLAETGRFVRAVSSPGGMSVHAHDGARVGGPGFVSTLKVRLVHAEVRRMIARSPRWRGADWGLPINQADMCGTVLLFSSVFAEGLELLGFRLTEEERADHLHLWRYVGWLMGVDPELLPATSTEAADLHAMIEGTQGPPDDDARALARALIEARPLTEDRAVLKRAERAIPLGYVLSRHLIGDTRADQLGYPRDAWQLAPKALRHLMGTAVELGRWLPLRDQALQALGERYWTTVVRAPGGGGPADFVLPQQLAVA